MGATMMPGAPVAEATFADLAPRISKLVENGHRPGLGTILVGGESAIKGIWPCVASGAVATAAAALPEPRMPAYFDSPMKRWTFCTPCDGFEALSRTSTTTLRPLIPPREFQ